jgi:hypothetical protein
MDLSKPFIIQKYNWSLSNYQYWGSNKELFNDGALEIIYDDHNGHMYQAIIHQDGLSINVEGLINKRLDKMMRKAFGLEGRGGFQS